MGNAFSTADTAPPPPARGGLPRRTGHYGGDAHGEDHAGSGQSYTAPPYMAGVMTEEVAFDAPAPHVVPSEPARRPANPPAACDAESEWINAEIENIATSAAEVDFSGWQALVCNSNFRPRDVAYNLARKAAHHCAVVWYADHALQVFSIEVAICYSKESPMSMIFIGSPFLPAQSIPPCEGESPGNPGVPLNVIETVGIYLETLVSQVHSSEILEEHRRSVEQAVADYTQARREGDSMPQSQ